MIQPKAYSYVLLDRGDKTEHFMLSDGSKYQENKKRQETGRGVQVLDHQIW